ncbi:DNA-binding transcriptional regulator BolA [Phymastichus coffea]|uniref:DNA-binding transcriptional regulator BolA n=1 Tax=Phymastichus coffea TaxID=108790 RepID=UPI00273A942E|nr:DNA-binding transcriptional regulator BolA [Phymastichus coffea]
MLKVFQRFSGYQFSTQLFFRNMFKSPTKKCSMFTSALNSKLNLAFSPEHLDIINESHKHNVPADSETHFKVIVISELFTDVPIIKRHRMIYEVLENELQTGIHALSIIAKTPIEWYESHKNITPTPQCKGGFGQ